MTADYKTVIRQKHASNLDKIPAEWRLKHIPSPEEQQEVEPYIEPFLSSKELWITNVSAVELLKNIQSGQLSALEVCEAFCHRSALVHQLTDCLIEIFYDRALQRARELDAYFQRTGKIVGPLHGIPISLKDQFNLKGITTSLGYVAPHISKELECIVSQKKPDEESLLARILYDAGAVFYVKTTVPMAMFGSETSSNLGITKNPFDRRKCPGGSSGGEAALLAGKGSVIGMGTDIGGSIRGPSVQCGLFGLRPSSNRFPYLGISNSYPNQSIVPSVAGPMCRYLEDMEYVSKVVFDAQSWFEDARVPPIPWRIVGLEAVNVGFMHWDRIVMPHPPILRALKHAKASLQESGVECLDVEPPLNHAEMATFLTDIYTCDDFAEIKRFAALGGEPLPDLLVRMFHLNGQVSDLEDVFKKVGQKYQYQQTYDKFWNDTAKHTKNGKPVDCIIMPGWACTSWKNGENHKTANSYTRFLNVLDYSVITLPVSHVTDSDEPFERTDFAGEMDKLCWEYYDKEFYRGMPIVLQLVCRRYEEEKCIALAKKLLPIIRDS
ncbi:hypothetical protein KL911_001562 [Ogataea haglerorum]|uniref:uncharacterized protein n=1 Tax=Ogataea haglerorum TaxID=1937702 RepID=UPI001C8965D1|nr:uncharacterized protein KL911_001562 [Ogataea haglerorum]KAG7755505.1 hypothetical protein KL911_001562 [Ogataea haglerorum]